MNTFFISDEELGAYLDGELEPRRAASVEATLKADPSLQLRLAALEDDKQRIAALYAPLLHRDLPKAWREQIAASRSPRVPIWRILPPVHFAGLVAAACVLIVAFWLGQRAIHRPADPILLEAMSAFQEPGEAIASSEKLELPQIAGLHLRAPDLRRFGYRLQMARLLPAENAAALRYVTAHGSTLDLFVRPSPGTTRFDMLTRGEKRICIWQDDVVSTVMTADVDAGTMMRLATAAYADLGA